MKDLEVKKRLSDRIKRVSLQDFNFDYEYKFTTN